MLEDVLQLGRRLLFADQLHRLQLVEVPVQLAVGLGDGAQHAVEEAAPDDRGGAQHVLEVVVQPVDAGHDDPLDRVRDGDVSTRAVASQRPLAASWTHGPGVDQGTDDLFDEEGVALGPADDRLPDAGREVVDLEQVVDQPGALPGRGGARPISV